MFRKKINFDLDEFRSRPLPSEQEVMSGWTGDLDKPVVSVICNTYNQEMYIEDAIRGFLIQETDFPFEVVINDDASTDSNPSVILEYANKYPQIIKPIFQKENQYSQGKKPTVISFKHTCGDYVALCEGDDFWIDKYKLKKQVDIMLSEDVDLCFSAAVENSGTRRNKIISNHYSNSRNISFEKVIKGGGVFCPTATLMLRRSTLDNLFKQPWFKTVPVGDIYIQAFGSKRSGAYFLNQPTSVYRRHSVGSVTTKKKNRCEWKKFKDRTIAALNCMEELWGGEFSKLKKNRIAFTYKVYLVNMLNLCSYKEFKLVCEEVPFHIISSSPKLLLLWLSSRFSKTYFMIKKQVRNR